MSGITNLAAILKTISPVLKEGSYVFCTVENNAAIDVSDIVAFFREEEAITVILAKETADRLNLTYSFVSAWITLTVHSSLEAVGLTAAFSTALTNNAISCNVVAAYYHDHIFVPVEKAKEAMHVLASLAND